MREHLFTCRHMWRSYIVCLSMRDKESSKEREGGKYSIDAACSTTPRPNSFSVDKLDGGENSSRVDAKNMCVKVFLLKQCDAFDWKFLWRGLSFRCILML